MHRATTAVLSILSALALAGACAAPSLSVIRRSGPPSALAGMTQVAVSLDSRSMSVDGAPLAQYLVGRGPDGPEMEQIFGEMNQSLVAGVQETSGLGASLATGPTAHPGQIQLAVQYLDVVPGYYRGFSAVDGSVHARVTFMVNGQPTDELDVTTRSRSAPAEQPTIRGRMNACGRRIGQLVGEYIHTAQ